MKLRISTIILALLVTGGFGSYASAQTTPVALSAEQAATLVWMREEEKLARDVYITMYDRWGLRVFNSIARAEQSHMDAMLTMLNVYGIDDPVTSDAVGAFNDPTLAGIYTQLIDSGNVSALDALLVGGYIEELDIKDLWNAIDESTQADITAAYENLLAGSYNHLRAFAVQVSLNGSEYVAQYLDQSEVDTILGDSGMTAQKGDGAWMVVGHKGEGMVIDVTDKGLMVMYWMTYDNDGNQKWLLGLTDETTEPQVHMNLYEYSGPSFGPQFDTNELVREQWGEVDIDFKNCAEADVNYQSFGYGEGNLQISRIYFAAGSLCQADGY